jgi:imidazolonepropionase-like amidohydrolase
MRLYLKNGRLIDGTGRALQERAAVVIEADTIVHAGPRPATDAPGDGVTTIDLNGRTMIPGLIEAHLHLSYNHVKVIADLDLNCPPEYSTLVSARNAELVLHCKLADLVVVNGDPLRDIGVLQDRQRLSVMKGGRFVTQHLS